MEKEENILLSLMMLLKKFGRRRRGTTKKEIISRGNTFGHWRWNRMEKEKGENSSWKKYGEGTGAKYLEKNIWLTEEENN